MHRHGNRKQTHHYAENIKSTNDFYFCFSLLGPNVFAFYFIMVQLAPLLLRSLILKRGKKMMRQGKVNGFHRISLDNSIFTKTKSIWLSSFHSRLMHELKSIFMLCELTAPVFFAIIIAKMCNCAINESIKVDSKLLPHHLDTAPGAKQNVTLSLWGVFEVKPNHTCSRNHTQVGLGR